MTSAPEPPPAPSRPDGSQESAPQQDEPIRQPPTPPHGFPPSQYPPYPPHAQYYWAGAPYPVVSPPPSGMNGQAIASFVLGLLAVVPASVILGIVALVRIGRTRQKGKGLAITGLVLSVLWMMAAGAGIAIAGAHYLKTTKPISALAPGTCFDPPKAATSNLWVTVVACTQPHDRQLYAKVGLSGTYPGLEADKQLARDACIQAESSEFIDPEGLSPEVVLHFYYPEQPAWQAGDPQAWCTLVASDGGQLTGELRQSAHDYTATQRSFLKLVGQTQMLRQEIADTLPSQWSQQRTLATQLAQADRTEARALTSAEIFNTGFLRATATALAEDDLQDAATADTLAQSSSQNDWASAVAALLSNGRRLDIQTLRANLGLAVK